MKTPVRADGVARCIDAQVENQLALNCQIQTPQGPTRGLRLALAK